jgi:GNAT superfamily N-acetyltransferase
MAATTPDRPGNETLRVDDVPVVENHRDIVMERLASIAVRNDPIRVRIGEAADLATLLEIDLDAGLLFERAGMYLDLPETHEFSVSERRHLDASLAAGTAIIATDTNGRALAFVALGSRDGAPYVEQISVRADCTRRGIGSMLLDLAMRSAAARSAPAAWLTTYDHLPWNRPFYERHGFVRVPEEECGPDIRAELDFQRRWLPLPAQRIAMRRDAR